ncbi:MAG: hypothetical protein C0412_17825 [Flavobacterium sp.]|nr:hypothetical protein [Flavobacterium sp.]
MVVCDDNCAGAVSGFDVDDIIVFSKSISFFVSVEIPEFIDETAFAFSVGEISAVFVAEIFSFIVFVSVVADISSCAYEGVASVFFLRVSEGVASVIFTSAISVIVFGFDSIVLRNTVAKLLVSGKIFTFLVNNLLKVSPAIKTISAKNSPALFTVAKYFFSAIVAISFVLLIVKR